MRAHAPAYPLWKRGNEMDQTIAFLGGDVRMSLLAQMMAAEGYDVCSWELTGAPKPLALCDALKADIIVLPLPAEKNGYLSGTELTMESLLRSLRREHRIFAGNVGNDASTLAQSLGLTITDYFASEELSVRNAIPTAEGAIEAAMKHTSVTLHGTPCLVLGFGRIGKVLAHDLSALGAKVSVSARKRSDLAWIDAFGYAPLHTNRLSGTLGEFRVVFNTVPHQVLDETLLAELPPDCLLIELASTSGFDMDAVETLRLSYLKAGGLPGASRQRRRRGPSKRRYVDSSRRKHEDRICLLRLVLQPSRAAETLRGHRARARDCANLVGKCGEVFHALRARRRTSSPAWRRWRGGGPCAISSKPSPSARRARWKCSLSHPARETRLPSSPTASRTAR